MNKEECSDIVKIQAIKELKIEISLARLYGNLPDVVPTMNNNDSSILEQTVTGESATINNEDSEQPRVF